MADLDFDLDSPQPKDFYWDNFVGLCAEVRRLRAIEDAARAFVQYGNEAVVADLDLDAIEAEPCITTTNGGQKPLVLLHVDKRDALVAEVRRLRAVRDAARGASGCRHCRAASPSCGHRALLVHALQEADRG